MNVTDVIAGANVADYISALHRKFTEDLNTFLKESGVEMVVVAVTVPIIENAALFDGIQVNTNTPNDALQYVLERTLKRIKRSPAPERYRRKDEC